MTEESFLAVSTGCLSMFNGNTRTRFTNNFAKPAKTAVPWVKSLFIDIEQINFEYTPLLYKNEDDADVIYGNPTGLIKYTLETCYSVQCIINQLTKTLSSIFYIAKHSEDSKGVKIVLGSYYDDVVIHQKLAKILKIENHFQNIQEEKYCNLKKDTQYISYESIVLNSFKSSYIDVICEEIEPYFCDSEMKKIVARVDVSNKINETIHMDTQLRRFYKIKPSVLEAITFEMRHPDGRKLLMQDGAPTIIKAKIKEMKTKSDFFYLQVHSKPTNAHPDNTPSNFTVELPNEIELKGEWEVALAYAELPPTENLFKEANKILLKKRDVGVKHAFSFIFINPISKKIEEFARIDFSADGVLPYSSLLKSMQDTTRDLIQIFVDEDEKAHLFLLRKDLVCFLSFTPKEVAEFALSGSENLSGLHKMDFADVYKEYNNQENDTQFKNMLYTHGIDKNFDAITCYQVKQAPSSTVPYTRFYFTLDEYYSKEAQEANQKKSLKELSEEALKNSKSKDLQEEKRLLQVFEKNYHVKRPHKPIPTWMFIYSDFVKPSLIADCYSNVLKLLPYKQNFTEGNTVFYTFTPLDFFTANRDTIRTLTFELRTHAGEIHDFRNNTENTSLTLYFQKVD
jgi:hypothetical protein